MKIKINNLRNLDFNESYDLKAVNVIVGKNSAGKSTFLRIFPLIRQSIEKRTSSPILWYGPYVDFGTFGESVSKYNKHKPIEISLQFDVDEGEFVGLNSSNFFSNYSSRTNKSTSFDFIFKIIEDNITELEFCVFNYRVRVVFNDKQNVTIFLGDKYMEAKVMSKVNTLEFLPYSIESIAENSENCLDGYKNYFMNSLLDEKLFDLLQKNSSIKVKSSNVDSLIKNISNARYSNFDRLFDKISNNNKIPKTIRNKFVKSDENKDFLDKVFSQVMISRVNKFINISNRYLESTFSNVDYIAPVRANAERYYRFQSLAVDSIDSRGENIPHFMNSITKDQTEELNKWLSNLFNFEIHNITTMGHNSLFIYDKRTKLKSNMTDCGFGFSQIMPILLQLWLSRNFENNENISELIIFNFGEKLPFTKNKIIVIEQPELHLHPALQARLIDTICKIANEYKKDGIEVHFLLETHSETMVNRLYRNMIKGIIGSNELNISIFDTDSNGKALIDFAKFDKDLNITNWPVGFFQPEV